MRVHGTLTKWHDDRGFGFITPAKPSSDIFVHISAFPRDGVRPRLNELISFEIEAQPDGKQRAVRVMRPAQKGVARPPGASDHRRPGGYRATRVLMLLVVVGLAAYGYSKYVKPVPADRASAAEIAAPETAQQPSKSYSCDGRTMCSQMTSCEEATHFIRNCPNTQMDGDRDGVPCESQWCE